MEILLIVALSIVLDVTALKWGFDSRDSINSPAEEKHVL